MRLSFGPGEDVAFAHARVSLLGRLQGWASRASVDVDEPVVCVLLDHTYAHGDGHLTRVTEDGLRGMLLGWFPRTVVMRPEEWPSVPATLHAWVDFLRHEGVLEARSDPVPALHRTLDEVARSFLRLMAIPSKHTDRTASAGPSCDVRVGDIGAPASHLRCARPTPVGRAAGGLGPGISPDVGKPTDIWPGDIWPTDVWPTDVWPTDVWPTDVWPGDVWPGEVGPGDVGEEFGPGRAHAAAEAYTLAASGREQLGTGVPERSGVLFEPVEIAPAEELATFAAGSAVLARMRDLTAWLGAGRALTARGNLRLADARELVALLHTGDVLDPVVRGRVRPTRSAAELAGLNRYVGWAHAAGFVRTVKGRLVPVRKAVPVLADPLRAWRRLFDALSDLGPTVCQPGAAPPDSARRPTLATRRPSRATASAPIASISPASIPPASAVFAHQAYRGRPVLPAPSGGPRGGARPAARAGGALTPGGGTGSVLASAFAQATETVFTMLYTLDAPVVEGHLVRAVRAMVFGDYEPEGGDAFDADDEVRLRGGVVARVGTLVPELVTDDHPDTSTSRGVAARRRRGRPPEALDGPSPARHGTHPAAARLLRPVRAYWSSAAHGDGVWRRVLRSEVDGLLDLAERLGAVTRDGELVGLTPLGVWAMRSRLAALGYHVPIQGDYVGTPAGTVVAVAASYDDRHADAELDLWCTARPPSHAAEDLAEVARATDDQAVCVVAVRALVRLGESGIEAATELRGDSVAGRYAAVMLLTEGIIDLDDITAQESRFLRVETLVATAREAGVDALLAELDDLGPVSGVVAFLAAVRDCGHPALPHLLDLVAARHPDAAVAKAARKARFQLVAAAPHTTGTRTVGRGATDPTEPPSAPWDR